MKIIKIVILLVLVSFVAGCARNYGSRKRVCDDFAIPATNKIYLYISDKYEPPEKVVSAIKSRTKYALVRVTDDVKTIDSIDEAGDDGFLLKIDITNILESVFARRIDINFALIENKTKTEVLNGKDAVRSRRGYNGVAVELGARTAKRISRILKCFEQRRNEL